MKKFVQILKSVQKYNTIFQTNYTLNLIIVFIGNRLALFPKLIKNSSFSWFPQEKIDNINRKETYLIILNLTTEWFRQSLI